MLVGTSVTVLDARYVSELSILHDIWLLGLFQNTSTANTQVVRFLPYCAEHLN